MFSFLPRGPSSESWSIRRVGGRPNWVSGSLLILLANSTLGSSWREEFDTDPFTLWTIADGPGNGFGDNSFNQFVYDALANEMIVSYDSSKPSVRLQRDLDRSYTDLDAFAFSATLRFDFLEAAPNDFMQLGFALTNSQTTGAFRTGTFPDVLSNTFDNVELAYYANVSDFFGGPYVTATVQGSPQGSDSAFDHLSFASVEYELPLETELVFSGHYNPRTTTLTYRIADHVTVSTDISALPPFGNPAGVFAVNRFAITTYFDGEDYTPETISLLATVSYESVEFTALGDADVDSDVDFVDFGGFQNCFSGPKGGLGEDCRVFDFDGDDDVDLEDFSVFRFVTTGP